LFSGQFCAPFGIRFCNYLIHLQNFACMIGQSRTFASE
jgi:hypothetical protein